MKKNESGQTLPLLSVLLVIFIGFVAMGVDLGQGYLQRRTNQNGADAAAMAAETALSAGAADSSVQAAIKNVLAAGGYSSAGVTLLSASNPSPGVNPAKVYVDAEYGTSNSSGATCTPLGGSYVGFAGATAPAGANCVAVTVTTRKKTFFSNIPIIGAATVGASASSSASWVAVNNVSTMQAAVLTASMSSNTESITIPSQTTPPSVGSTAQITGATPSTYNTTGTVTSSSSTSASITVSPPVNNPGTYSGGGVVTFTSSPTPTTPTPTPTAAGWVSGSGEGYAIWGGQRADNRILQVGDTAVFFADSGWNYGNDVQTSCSPCEYDATQNYKGLADNQCFVSPLTVTCTGPNGAHGNPADSLAPGTIVQVLVVSRITHRGSVNILQRIGLVNLKVLASCPATPSYLLTPSRPVCGTIVNLISGLLNENLPVTPTPTPTSVKIIGTTH